MSSTQKKVVRRCLQSCSPQVVHIVLASQSRGVYLEDGAVVITPETRGVTCTKLGLSRQTQSFSHFKLVMTFKPINGFVEFYIFILAITELLDNKLEDRIQGIVHRRMNAMFTVLIYISLSCNSISVLMACHQNVPIVYTEPGHPVIHRFVLYCKCTHHTKPWNEVELI